MALIKCTECGNMISDKASVCPHCGCPVNIGQNCSDTNHEEEQVFYDEDDGSNSKKKWLYGFIALLVFALIGGGVFFFLKNNQKDSVNVQEQEGSIAEGKYYVIIYNDNTGGFYAPNGGRICGLKLRNGRKEPLTMDLNSEFMIMGNNSDNLYVTSNRAFSDYSDYLKYTNDYNSDKALGVDVTRTEKDGVLTIVFDFTDGQIDKFDIPAVKMETYKNEYTAVYYNDETGDLFDDDGSHICGFEKGFVSGDYRFNLSKTVTLYGTSAKDIIINEDKVYVKYEDFSDDCFAYHQQESKAKAKTQKEETGNATVFHFSKTANSQGMVGKESSYSSYSHQKNIQSEEEIKGTNASKSINRFVGTYWLDFGLQTERFYNSPIVVLDDGRCLIVYETVSGSKDAQLLGNIQYLSDKAFTIKGQNSSFGPSLPYNYIDAEGKKHKYAISVKSYHWHNYDQPVFDIEEMRVYREKSQYQNRDVATAYFADIKSKTSSTSLTQ